VSALPPVHYAPVIGAPPSSGGGSHRMVTTLGWTSADPGTRCGLPGGHGGTETYDYVVSVMNIWRGGEFGRSVSRSVGRSVGRSVSRSVCRSVSQSVGRSTCTAVPSRPATVRQPVRCRHNSCSFGHSCVVKVPQFVRQISFFTSRRYSGARVGYISRTIKRTGSDPQLPHKVRKLLIYRQNMKGNIPTTLAI
jgi:hypothetical protein